MRRRWIWIGAPWVLLSAGRPALADDLAWPREDEPLAVRRYDRISGRPARARTRNARGVYEAWVFPDGMVASYKKYARGKLSDVGRFDATGDLLTVANFTNGVPTNVSVYARKSLEIDVSAWGERELPGVKFRAPGPPAADGSWAIEGGRLTVATGPEADVFSGAFRDALLAGCGCAEVDRSISFVDGVRGVQYLLALPDPDAPAVAGAWAAPIPGGTLLVGFATPAGPEPVGVDDPVARLAAGHVAVALIDIQDPP